MEHPNDMNSDGDSTRRNTNSTQSGTESIILRPTLPCTPVQKMNSDSSTFLKSLLDAETSLVKRQVKKTLSMPANSEESDSKMNTKQGAARTADEEILGRCNTALFDCSHFAGPTDQTTRRAKTSESSSTTADNFRLSLLNDLSMLQDTEAGERTITTTFGLDYGNIKYQTGEELEIEHRQEILDCLHQMQTLASTSGSHRFYLRGALSCVTTALQFLRNSLAAIEEESVNLALSDHSYLHQEAISKQKPEYVEIYHIHKMIKQTFDELSVALARDTECNLDHYGEILQAKADFGEILQAKTHLNM